MYIKEIHIENIRAIESLKINFGKKLDGYPGWHVIIGDNGAGKSSLVRSIALALFGPTEAAALRQNWDEWLRAKKDKAQIELQVYPHKELDKRTGRGKSHERYLIGAGIQLKRQVVNNNIRKGVSIRSILFDQTKAENYLWGKGNGWFSASFGPFRRFVGGDKDLIKLNYTNPKVAAHLSAFGEDVALTETLEWLKELNYKRLEGKEEGGQLEYIKTFINEGGLLPHGAKLKTVSSDGVFFEDGSGAIVDVNQMSDGYRSILSLTFELIRQMILAYGDSNLVFRRIRKRNPIIDLPGVVLIDEIDAHLHPTWQVRIGQWFTKYFPKLQFIVTTHSPLVCRAAEKGSIWRLAAPGSDQESGEVKGLDRQRLIYGNVLDAYGTEVFGENVTRSSEAHELLDELAILNKKSIKGSITHPERERMEELRSILPTE